MEFRNGRSHFSWINDGKLWKSIRKYNFINKHVVYKNVNGNLYRVPFNQLSRKSPHKSLELDWRKLFVFSWHIKRKSTDEIGDFLAIDSAVLNYFGIDKACFIFGSN
jgi:hypothetical protein